MSELKATPGPWFLTGARTKYIEARIGGGLIQEVASVGPTDADKGYGVQQLANANLISAAPELYAACNKALSAIDSTLDRPMSYKLAMDTLEVLSNALAKARGEI